MEFHPFKTYQKSPKRDINMNKNDLPHSFGVDSVIEAPMAADDLDEVTNIESYSFNPPWTRGMFADEIANPRSVCLVFKYSHRVVGFECFWIILDEAHLLNIAVSPEFRRRSVGTRMMNRLEEICAERGVGRIILDVATRNTPARSLYRKSGFSSIGFRKRYYPDIKDDAIVMEKWVKKNV